MVPDWLRHLGTDWCFKFAGQLRTQNTVDDLILVGTPNLVHGR